MIDRVFLKLLCSSRANFDRFFRVYNSLQWPEPVKILGDCIVAYYSRYTDSENINKAELRTFFDKRYPVHHLREHIFKLIDEVFEAEINEQLLNDTVKGVIQRSCAAELSEISMQVLQGESERFNEIENVLEKYRTVMEEADENRNPFFSASLSEMDDMSAKSGLSWPLKAFQDALGPLCGGTSGHIFARPNTGKTSMAIFCMAHWAQQMDEGCILWCNNEELNKRMWLRYMCSVLHMTQEELFAERERNEMLFKERGGDKVKLYDSPHMELEEIESLIREYEPKVVVIDIADKVHFHGESSFDNTVRLQRLYALYRELCKKYEVDVITLGQASADAHGKKFLEYAWMDHSKTGKAGELDWICGIGVDLNQGKANVRYLYFCKNKLTGKHNKYVVTIDPLRCAYYDLREARTV